MSKRLRLLLSVVVVAVLAAVAWPLLAGGGGAGAGAADAGAVKAGVPTGALRGEGGPPMDPAEAANRKRYAEILETYRAGDYKTAYAGYFELARTWPKGGTLGMVVASLASTAPQADAVKVLTDDADTNPTDVLKQFVAGVGSHYYAHQSADSKEEKQKYYEQTLKYLARVRPTYDHEPRTFIYLAVSHFRLGHQKEAEAAIDEAIKIAADDPDAFYCRAEIYQRTDVDQALKDLQVYIDMTQEFKKRGAVLSEAKERRVIRMKEHLLAVKAGKASNAEIFDPVEAEGDPMADPKTATDGGTPSAAPTNTATGTVPPEGPPMDGGTPSDAGTGTAPAAVDARAPDAGMK